MALLHDMQSDLISGEADIAPILLKFRLLAAKLGSGPLQEWVKHELEGYPNSVEVPDYRTLAVSYTGTFTGPFGSGIKNAPIPSYLIKKFGGEGWVTYKMRQSIATVDEIIKGSRDTGGELHLNSSDLILLLQGNVYNGYACNEVTGHLAVSQMRELQHAVRSRALELLLELESSIPAAAQIDIGGGSVQSSPDQSGKVSQIFYQTIHGSMTNVSNNGSIGIINIGISAGNSDELIKYLVQSGLPEGDANEFAAALASESPQSKEEPFGAKAKTWIAENLKKAVNGTWKIGVGVATDVLKAAALSYYGFESG